MPKLSTVKIYAAHTYNIVFPISFLGRTMFPHVKTFASYNSNFSTVEDRATDLKRMSLRLIGADSLPPIVKKLEDTLEELELQTLYEDSLFISIFNDFYKLKVLKIDAEDAPEHMTDFDALRPNLSITTGILRSNYYSGQSIDGLVSKMPNLQTLVLHIKTSPVPNSLMKFIALNLTKLKVLEISRVGDGSFQDLNIPSLRELHIHATHELTIIGWKEITENCRNIEKLSVGFVDDSFAFYEQELEVIGRNLNKLKNLVIGNGFLASKKIFDDLMDNCPSLESFTIIEHAIKEDPSMIEIFTERGPKLYLRSSSFEAERIDFNLWANENVDTSESDDETESFSDDFMDDNDESIDEDEGWFVYTRNDEDDEDDEEDEDDEFVGKFRPG